MKRLVLALGLILAALPAWAQSRVIPMCGTTSTNPTTFAPCDSVYPLPVSGTFTGTVTANSSATAAAALPTLSAGSTVIYQSLGGAQYVQPVFASTAGGGTQVDATHGLPVAVLAGSAVIGHVITDSGSTTAVTQATAANLNATVTGSGTAGSAAVGVMTVQGIASMTKLLVTPDSVALPANQSVNISQINAQTAANGGATGSLLVEQGCAGQTVANTTVTPINNAGASTSLKLVSKVSAKQVYICSLDIIAAGANNIALVEGTFTTTQCDTATAGMAGGATAATGWNFAANGGLVKGGGQGVVYRTATTNHDVCLFFSAANQVSGSITWAQF